MKAVFDTNILVDHLNGVDEARGELERFAEPLISVITWTEVMVGVTKEDEASVQKFFNRFQIVGLSKEIAALGVSLRKHHRLKLPDAVVYATARAEGCLFITRDKKVFDLELPDIRFPYELRVKPDESRL